MPPIITNENSINISVTLKMNMENNGYSYMTENSKGELRGGDTGGIMYLK